MLCTPTFFSLQLFRAAEGRRGDEVAVGAVDDAGEKGEVHPARGGAQHRSRNRVRDLDLTGGEGGDGLRAAADIDDFYIHAVFAEQSLLDSDPQRGDLLVERGVRDADRRRLRRL